MVASKNRFSYKQNEILQPTMNFHLRQLSDVPKENPMNILHFLRFENYYCRISSEFQKKLKKNIPNNSKIARKLNKSRETISRIKNVDNYWINIATLLELTKFLDINEEEVFSNINFIKTKNSFPLEFNTKNLISPAFFRVLGHILGDGGIHTIEKEGKYRAFYVNNEKELLESFKEDIITLFGDIQIYERARENHGDEIWLPTTLGYLFYNLFCYEELSKEKRVPSFILKTKEKKLLASFLQALYDDEGYIYPQKNMIVIAQKSRELIEEIRHVISLLGIRPNQILIQRSKTRTTMYYFSITHKDNITLFSKIIGFKHPIKKKKLEILMNKYGGY